MASRYATGRVVAFMAYTAHGIFVQDAHEVLVATGMRELVTLSASGRMQTPEDIMKRFLFGADQVQIHDHAPGGCHLGLTRATVCFYFHTHKVGVSAFVE